MIAATSRIAYEDQKSSGKLTFGQRQVMLWLHKQAPGRAFTRAEISQGARLPLQSVCGRVHELLNAQPPFLEELPAADCPVTGSRAHPVRIPQPNTPQRAGPVPAQANVATVSPARHLDDKPASGNRTADEQLVHSEDAKGKPLSYTACGHGPGWPPDQDEQRRRQRRRAA